MDASGKPQISELQSGLNDIVETNKEILRTLDLIQEKERKKQRKENENCHADNAAIERQARAVDQGPKQSANLEPAVSTEDKTKITSDKNSHRQSNPKFVTHKVQDVNTDRHHGHFTNGDSPDKLGHLKFHKIDGSKPLEISGFSEKMILSEIQVKFGKSLKAHKTLTEQDNRICMKFELPLINKGCLYASQRDPECVKEMHARPGVSVEQKEEINPETVGNRNRSDFVREKRPLKSILKKPSTEKPSVPRTNTNDRKGDSGKVVKRTLASISKRRPTQVSPRPANTREARKQADTRAVVSRTTAPVKRSNEIKERIEEDPGQLANQTTPHIAVMKMWNDLDSDPSRSDMLAITEDVHREEIPDNSEVVEDHPIPHYEVTDEDVHSTGIIEEDVTRLKKEWQRKEIAEEERVTMNEGLWSEYAHEEVKKGQIARDIREKGIDTIFCLDLSKSMKGEPLRQAKGFVKGFIEGIQNSKLGDDVFEHVALVTFGSETKVQQHLTCDYFEVLRKLDRLQAGGPTPLFAGLTMTWAAILGAGTVFSSNGYKIHPRVYLLSDGKMTPSSFIAGPDECMDDEAKNEKGKVIGHSANLHKEYQLTINAVPVGEFDMSLLESITKETGGKIVSPENWKGESRTFRNYLKACSTGQSKQLHKMMVDVTNADEEDQAQMNEFLRTHKREGDESGPRTDEDDDLMALEFDRYPPLGSRVKQKVNPSKPLYGTVTKHFKDGFGVTWDHVDEDGDLRVKMESLYHIEVVNEPRVLKDELIAEGCRVIRGKDWHYGNQDGKPGNEGSVFKVKENGWVLVRWDFDGSKETYKYGCEGKFEVQIIQPNSEKTRQVSKNEKVLENGKLDRRNEKNPGLKPNQEVVWTWRNKDGTWKNYPAGINTTIETSYKRNPRGTVLITVQDKQFRVVFSRMEQLDLNSDDKFSVSREQGPPMS